MIQYADEGFPQIVFGRADGRNQLEFFFLFNEIYSFDE